MYTARGTLDRSAAVERYAPMVRRLASQLIARLPANVEIDDLIQAGMIGLMDALSRYETGHGAQFETYATQRIRGAMLDELRSNDWLPRSLRKTSREVEHAVHQVEQHLGRSASETEMLGASPAFAGVRPGHPRREGGGVVQMHDPREPWQGRHNLCTWPLPTNRSAFAAQPSLTAGSPGTGGASHWQRES